jgi:hypothetical protein
MYWKKENTVFRQHRMLYSPKPSKIANSEVFPNEAWVLHETTSARVLLTISPNSLIFCAVRYQWQDLCWHTSGDIALRATQRLVGSAESVYN